ncbi:mitochondrial carrier protein RIM2 [Phlebopus sp. FC_14]|nr:mitochondrial carrier protein RIM2 [Phlebopus sp. FC_14]KAH7881934.1 mitochondrial carrier protein RIM2 [Phlebopus sp. FC_14]
MSATTTTTTSQSSTVSLLPAKSWRHFVAGGLGGMCGAIVTSPFDVVKTRLQSSLFREIRPQSASAVGVVGAGAGVGVATFPHRTGGGLLWNFVETGHILRDIYRHESPGALFKGLGATLVGVIPARSINFFTYGNGKHIIANTFNHGQENSYVHLTAAAIAGIVTGTATNPIWVVKTRVQLVSSEKRHVAKSSLSSVAPGATQTPSTRALGGSAAMIKQIFREEGFRGFYKGLSASYLGVTEGTIQWVLYERLKKVAARTEGRGGVAEWGGMLLSAGTAKCVASLITYPHEVLRTRLRQPRVNGVVKYTGLVQTLRTVIAEEGARSLYGGLSAHLMRVVPNAAVMYSIYEGILRWGQSTAR